MNKAAIIHRPTLDYIYPISSNKLNIRLSIAKNDMKNISVLWWFRFESDKTNIKVIPMTCLFEDNYSQYYECILDANELAAYIRYCFVLDDGKESVLYGASGFTNNKFVLNENYFEFLWPNKGDIDHGPLWANNQIYYQIFPERFNNGTGILTPNNAMTWGSEPTRENFMGGDLIGIINKLDYIKDLGVTCLYLTPIFKAPSNHKYDTVDYYEIDPSFGKKEDLKKLINEVHNKGLKIILDGVFNHCGYYFDKFQDVVINGEKSKYKDWFFIHNYPVSLEKKNYDCVGHYKWMPKMNLDNPEVRDYFIKVGEYWIKEFNIDGWRLDVADEISISFWQDFSLQIKRIKPDALLLGETWTDAGKLVSTNRLDSAMNYLFKDAVVAWLAKKKIKPTEFNHLINKMYSLYHQEVIHRLYNPLDSHDTARFLKECNDNVNDLKLAVALQMTLPGSPAIFYGDEVGLSGDNDPGCRLCMEWDENKQNRELLSWYKKLISIRKNLSLLNDGRLKTIITDDQNNVYGFERFNEKEKIVVVINAGNNNFNISSLINTNQYDEIIVDGYITENAGIVSANSVHIYKKRKES